MSLIKCQTGEFRLTYEQIDQMKEIELQLAATDNNYLMHAQAKYQLESLCLEMKNAKYQQFMTPEDWQAN